MRTAPIVLLAALTIAGSSPTTVSQAPAPDDVDRLLAPIALYPDQLLAQMLLCAGDPRGVTALDRFVKAHPALKGSELQDAAVTDNFEPSFVAMALFPQIVSTMAADLEWTTRLGEIFATNRTAVFDSIQRLRAQAQHAGTLKSTPQQSVETQTTSTGQHVIVIEPANPQVVYVPQYNPQTVYVVQPTTVTNTVVVKEDNSAEAAAAGLIGFTAGIAIGAAMDNHYYYGPYGWHGGAYMYNDAWNDYYDAREDAREDWMDHREDLAEDRGDRARDTQEQRSDRRDTQTEQRSDRRETQGQQRTDRQQNRQENRPSSTYESRGYGEGKERTATQDRSGTRTDAFSGYSSGKSTRAASSRGQSSRGSRSRGGGRRR
jgi:hypothetical protein